MRQRVVTIPYASASDGPYTHQVYGLPHETRVNKAIKRYNAKGWRVVQVLAHRVGEDGTCLLLERK